MPVIMPGDPAENRIQFIVTGPLVWNGETHHQMMFVRPGEREARIWCELLPGKIPEVGTVALFTPNIPAGPPYVLCCWILPPDIHIIHDFRGIRVSPDWKSYGMPPFHFSLECDTNEAQAVSEKLSAAYEKYQADKAAQAQTNAWYEQALGIIDQEYREAVEKLNKIYQRNLKRLKREHNKRVAAYKLEIKHD